MKISVQNGKACEKILKIEVSGETIQKEYDDFYRSVATKAKVPGFRPGKAPRDILVMHFQKEARDKVMENLITSSYRQAVQEHSLQPLGYPDIKGVEFQGDKLSYEALIEIRPKIKLSKVTGLIAKKEKTEVKEEDIQNALKRVQESFAQQKTVEDRPAQMGDLVVADYVCTVGDREVERRIDDWFELKEKEYLQGMSSQLVGVKAGDEKEINLTLPENFSRKDYAGKPALFNIKIKEVKCRILPELNDDLAKDAGDFKSLEELKKKIEGNLRALKERDVEIQYEKGLLDELVQKNKIEIPEKMVSRRLDRLVQDALERAKRQGVPESQFGELEPQFRKNLEPEARHQIHLVFLLDEIAGQQNITVTEEDFTKRVQAIAGQVRQSEEAVRKYYEGHEDARLSLYDQIRSEKAIEFIKDHTKK